MHDADRSPVVHMAMTVDRCAARIDEPDPRGSRTRVGAADGAGALGTIRCIRLWAAGVMSFVRVRHLCALLGSA